MRSVILIIALALAPLLAAPVHATTCTPHEQAMSAAYATRDPAAAARIVREATTSVACRGTALTLLGRNAALTALAATSADANTSSGQHLARLIAAETLGRPWQLLATLGDVHSARKSHISAAAYYQEALDDIRDETFNPKPPPLDVIKAIFRKAEGARLLASQFVRRTDRSGATSGLACVRYRDLTVERVAVPIEFKYNETTFNDKGRDAADDLFKLLVEQGAPDIVFTGHTDPIGSAHFNQELSEKRAEAVKAFLVERGYTATKIRTGGLGKTTPFVAADPRGLTTQEQHQLDRRVELERKGGTSCGS